MARASVRAPGRRPMPSPRRSRARLRAGRGGRPRCRTARRRRPRPGARRDPVPRTQRPRDTPAARSWRGRPGRAGRWSIAITGLVTPKIRIEGFHRSSLRRRPRRARPGPDPGGLGAARSAITTSTPSSRSRASSAAGADGSVTRVATRSAGADDDLRRGADLRAVGDDDDALGLLECHALHRGLFLGQLGDAPPQPRSPPRRCTAASTRYRDSVALATGPTQVELVPEDGPARGHDPHRPGPQQARDRQAGRDDHELAARGKELRELLGGAADPDEDDARVLDERSPTRIPISRFSRARAAPGR